ncbi:MAG: porin [Sneathiella sp.]
MKKAILGTTALVAVGAFVAAPASAAEKIKLGVGGYMQSTYYYLNTDDDGAVDRISDKITQEGEVFFTGSTTLDNGIKFGVNVQLEAYTNGDQIDETYVWVEGAFGRVLLGSEDSAAYLMHYTSPSPVPMYSADSANIYPAGYNNTTRPNMFADTDKVTYFTPRFAGFQLGASYVPDGTAETGSGGASPYVAPLPKGSRDRGWSAAANYVNKFGGVDVAVSAAYQSADIDGSSDDHVEYAFGTSVGFAGFTIGAGYGKDNDIAGVDGNDSKAWSAGLTYGMGPWSVGVQYSKTEFETGGVDTDGEIWLVGGQYTLGPGITAFGGVQFTDNDTIAASTATAVAGDSTAFFVGTALSF